MPKDYEALAEDLKAIGIPCAEDAWNTRPTGSYITYELEFEVDADRGDNRKVARAWEGSVDLFAKKGGEGYPERIEAALEERCEGAWMCETPGRWDKETGLFHYEWSFQTMR